MIADRTFRMFAVHSAHEQLKATLATVMRTIGLIGDSSKVDLLTSAVTPTDK